MEKIDAQTIITLLLADEKLREEVLQAVEPVEIKRLYEQSRRITEKMRELEMRQDYLEAVVKELEARHQETEERLRRLEAIVRQLLQNKHQLEADRTLGFLIVRKPWTDTTLN
ncbi:MAG: hypothetical protein ACUVTY_09150 [Armatimonadota bacterium]